MTKIYGLFGSMTGKLADTVMTVRNGQQIARKYQPVVYNPSTAAQVEQRAKLKLISQLSASLADMIAFRREGSVSARNIFTKKNFAKATYATNQASFPIDQVDLTGGVLECVASIATGDNALDATVFIPVNVKRVVYAFYAVEDQRLRLLSNGVETNSGSPSVTVSYSGIPTVPVFFVAYGIRENTDAARAKFENMEVENVTPAATLDVVRTLSVTDVTLTATATARFNPSEGLHSTATERKKK